MTRLLLLSAFAGSVLTAAAAWSLRSPDLACAAEMAPARESTADQLEAVARGCAAGGAEVSFGIQDGVVVLRCRQAPLNLGVMPAGRVR